MRLLALGLVVACSSASPRAATRDDASHAGYDANEDRRHWFAGDMHMHVAPPDSRDDVRLSVTEIATAAARAGMDFVVLTPHLWPWRWEKGHSEWERAWRELAATSATIQSPTMIPGVEWTTGDEPLKVCAFPARIALDMALEVIDEERVLGLVIDAGAESELCLTRAELASILAGRALPLMAYVSNIPEEEKARTLLAEAGEPPPAELLQALASWAEKTPAALSHRLDRTFNPDRDLEPHLTLTLRVAQGANRSELFSAVTQALEGKLPPPGYLDVLFEEAPE